MACWGRSPPGSPVQEAADGSKIQKPLENDDLIVQEIPPKKFKGFVAFCRKNPDKDYFTWIWLKHSRSLAQQLKDENIDLTQPLTPDKRRRIVRIDYENGLGWEETQIFCRIAEGRL